MTTRRRFMFKLAVELGRTVAELEQTMTNKEFNEWQQYAEIEPFFVDRVEIMLARLTSIYNNTHYKQKTSLIDFMLSMSKEDKENMKRREMGSKITRFFKGLKNGS